MRKLLALSLLVLCLAGGYAASHSFDGGDPIPPHCPMSPCH